MCVSVLYEKFRCCHWVCLIYQTPCVKMVAHTGTMYQESVCSFIHRIPTETLKLLSIREVFHDNHVYSIGILISTQLLFLRQLRCQPEFLMTGCET